MAINETTLMHYVPQCYLRKFSADNDTIYGLRKESNKLFVDKIKNVCAKNNFYKLDGETKEERQLIEIFYQQNFENSYNDTYQLLTNPNLTEIDFNQRKQIISFILSLFFRNFSWYKGFSQFVERNMEYCYHMIKNYNLNSKIVWDEKTIFDFDKISFEEIKKTLKDKSKEIVIKQQIVAFNLLLKLRINDNILVKKIEEEDHEFVTSDSPAVMHDRHNDSFIIPFNLDNILMLTIDNKHYVKLMRWETDYYLNKITRWSANGIGALAEIFINNYDMYNNSNHYILGSESSIKKFKEIRIKYAHAFAPLPL